MLCSFSEQVYIAVAGFQDRQADAD